MGTAKVTRTRTCAVFLAYENSYAAKSPLSSVWVLHARDLSRVLIR